MPDDGQGTADGWDPGDYDDDHAYVHECGRSVVDLLDPQPGERVLDLGCGTGHLTAEVVERVGGRDDGERDGDGTVVGIDRSADMVAAARETYAGPAFRQADASAFDPVTLHGGEPFDAVFSNAALHWIDDQAAVAERAAAALLPGGRFVAELGGRDNVSRIVEAVLHERRNRGLDASHPWYFPTVGEHASLLERHGFEVRFARLFDRPTDLTGGPDGLRNWLETFGDSLLAGLAGEEREAVLAAVEDRLRADLWDAARETWIADYRRLRFEALVPDDGRR